MTIISNIIGSAALAALFVVFYALGVSAGREATQQQEEDIRQEILVVSKDFENPGRLKYLSDHIEKYEV